jgi:hypothetical protein
VRLGAVEVLMPTSYDKLAIFFCKTFSFSEFCDLQTFGFPKKNFISHEKNSLSIPFANMHMDGFMVIAVKEEYVSVLFKNSGHLPLVAEGSPYRNAVVFLVAH